MSYRQIIILFLSLLLFFIFPYKSFAWSCANSLEVKYLYKEHDSVFIGSVFLIDNDYLFYAYKTSPDNYLYKYEEGEYATDTWCGGTKELSLANYDLEQISDMKRFHLFLQVTSVLVTILTVIIVLIVFMKRKNQSN